ncbi:MAG: bacillithiol biosynthesis cysteine-adding enzyme BshC [Candidatus Zixiibacteriota bacterium]|nr:MAG: bacillithiol biosynthesis cysteine-adding enzyme BshC [candidate division Zixibacteria bacterium]
MSNLIAPSKSLGYSNIFLDFLADASPARHFYPSESIVDVAAGLDAVEYRREEICRILTAQNRLYGASQQTLDNIERLKRRSSVCLFAGQQAGLFGGPLLVVYKALALVKAARLYETELNRPVIPVFWIAGDDHDFDEVNHMWVIDRASELTRVSYDARPSIELPTSEIEFSDSTELEKAKEHLRNALGQTDFTNDLYGLIDEAYTENDTFVTAFGKLMASLTSDLGLVFFSPGDAEAKQLAVDLFISMIDNEEDLQHRLDSTNDEIKSHGYHLQVEKSAEASHLFYNLDGRKPVVRHGDKYLVGEKSLSRAELIDCIRNCPERFSPDVMVRPVLQSFLFPVISQKGGAAEIAYLAQIGRIFELFGRVTPYYRARPSLTIVERRFEKLMAEFDIGFEEVAGDIEQVVNRVLSKSFPDDIERQFNEFREHLRERFGQLNSTSLKFDPGLKKLAEQTMGKIDFAVKGFEGKVFSSHKKKSQETRDRIYRLWHALYPNRNFQERSLNITYFLSRYGRGFVNFLYEKMDSEQKAHQLVNLSEYGE